MTEKTVTKTTTYDTVQTSGFRLDFKKNENGGDVSVVCYIKRDDESYGFATYDKTKQSLLIQLSKRPSDALKNDGGLLSAICQNISEIAG